MTPASKCGWHMRAETWVSEWQNTLASNRGRHVWAQLRISDWFSNISPPSLPPLRISKCGSWLLYCYASIGTSFKVWLQNAQVHVLTILWITNSQSPCQLDKTRKCPRSFLTCVSKVFVCEVHWPVVCFAVSGLNYSQLKWINYC